MPEELPAASACGDMSEVIENVAACDGFFECALSVRLDDVEVLRGDAPATATMRFGRGITTLWSPFPDLCNEPAGWIPAADERRVEPGQRIGAALYVDPDFGLLSPKEGVLFQLDADDVVVPQEFLNADCIAPVPAGLAGLTIADLRARAADVRPSEETDAEVAALRPWQPAAQSRLPYVGAMCFERCE